MFRLPLHNLRSPLAIFLFVGTTIIGLSLDLGTKYFAYDKLVVQMVEEGGGHLQPISQTYAFLPGWLEFYATNNYGAVFGLGKGHRWFFVAISFVAIAFLGGLFLASARTVRIYQFTLGILLAGVLGNLYDRAVYGYVRDMIHALPRWPNLFPWIFNVADMMLCVGVGLMLVMYVFAKDPAKPDESRADPQKSSTG